MNFPFFNASLARLPRGQAVLSWFVLATTIAATLACGSLTGSPTPTPTPDTLSDIPSTATPTLPPTPTASPPTSEAVGAQSPLPSPVVPLTPTPVYPWSAGEVRVYPGPDHYVGDLLTVELIVHNLDRLPDPIEIPLQLDNQEIASTPEIARSPLREDALVFRWVWDTSQVSPGQYRLSALLPSTPQGQEQKVRIFVNLLPGEDLPDQERTAQWEQRNTPGCCLLSFISNTAAGRDIDALSASAEDSVVRIEGILGAPIEGRPIPVTFIDNIWGNGGYLKDDLVVSYVDRNYAAPDSNLVLRHEIAHWAMRQYDTGQTPSLLSEGIAVTLAGGHFKLENIPVRAAALAELGLDQPLGTLADDFWLIQHEAAYLQAAGLTTYLIETYGINRYLQFYSFTLDEQASPSEWLDAALRRYYATSTGRAELDYRRWLAEQQPTSSALDDVRLTLLLMDTSRRYQDLYYQYQESLPATADAIAVGRTAEFIREPRTVYNLTLESMLLAGHRALAAGDTLRAEAVLEAVVRTLEDADFSRELVADYLAIVQEAADRGLEVQEIVFNGDMATVIAVEEQPTLRTLSAAFRDGAWRIEQ